MKIEPSISTKKQSFTGKNFIFGDKSRLGDVVEWFCKDLKSTQDVFEVVNDELVKKTVPLTRIDKFKFHGPNVHGAFIAGCYLINTKRSDKIPEERKTPLILNSIFNASLALIGSYSIMGLTKKLREKFIVKVFNETKKMPMEAKAREFFNKIPKHAGFVYNIFISCMLFRYITPVLATPLAELGTKFLIKNGYIENPNQQEKALIEINSELFKNLKK